VTTLWIIAGVAGAVLLLSIVFLVLRREEEPMTPPPLPPRTSRQADNTWDEAEEGTRLASIPPPAGVPPFPTMSDQIDLGMPLASQELWLEDDDPTGPVPKILITAAGSSDPGRKRDHNEDAFLLAPEHELYAIADGMGGYAAGEIASQLCVDTLRDCYARGDFGRVEEGFPIRGAELIAAIRTANANIYAEAKRDTQKSGMGTTIVAARFSPGRKRVYIAHVGDSRCYRVRDGSMQQLTHDHTLGAAGIPGPSAGKLSRAVGVFDRVEVELTIDEPLPGDFYVLCSDGLYKMVPDLEIQRTVLESESLEETVDQLIAIANARGGRDNVSAVVLGIDEPNLELRESGEVSI
jgi:protein phosphatase